MIDHRLPCPAGGHHKWTWTDKHGRLRGTAFERTGMPVCEKCDESISPGPWKEFLVMREAEEDIRERQRPRKLAPRHRW